MELIPAPIEAGLADVSNPDQVVGTKYTRELHSRCVLSMRWQRVVGLFLTGEINLTIKLDRPAKVFNNANADVVIDGGGLVTLSGNGVTWILYMNTYDPNLDLVRRSEASRQ